MRCASGILVVILIVGFGSVVPASAKMYVGAGIGNTFYSSDIEDALEEIKEIDSNSTAWKIFGTTSPWSA